MLDSGKTPEQLFAEREKRFYDAIALKKPDRVPILPLFGSFPSHYSGATLKQEMWEPETYAEANFKAVVDFEPDVAITTPTFGWALAALGGSR